MLGISTHGVYPQPALLRAGVRSYRTFSPLPRLSRGGLFSVALSVSHIAAEPRPLAGVAPCVVRTFLLLYSKPASGGLSNSVIIMTNFTKELPSPLIIFVQQLENNQ